MRKLSVFIAVLALVSGACIGGDDTVTSVTTTLLPRLTVTPTTTTTQPEATQSDELAVATETVDAWNAGWAATDSAAVAALFTDDGVYKDPGIGMIVGREAIARDVDIRGPGTTRVARTGDLVATDHGTFIYPVEFDFEGETFDGEVEVQLEGNLISLGEWLYWRPKEAERMISDPVFSGSVDGINLYNANSKQQHLVEWAIARFDTAGLDPPPVSHITFPPTAACVPGRSGMTFCSTETCSIDICTPADDFTAATALPLTARRTMLHELGHAWNATFITQATQQEFIALRNLDQWKDDVWQDSGNEQAAEILMWGLIEDPLAHRIPETTCTELHQAFQLLTGTTATLRQSDCTDP